jgi:hypothetical protein
MILGNNRLKSPLLFFLFYQYLFSTVTFRGDPNNGNITRNDHDLVLLKLQNRAQFTNRVRPIRLPTPMNDRITPENMQQCIVSGFGTIKDARRSNILKYLTVPIVERNQWYSLHVYLFFNSNSITELFL